MPSNTGLQDVKEVIKEGEEEDWFLRYSLFEKTVASHYCVHARSAMSYNSKKASISQEVKKKVFNCDNGFSMELRKEVLDRFSVKMRRSGYSLEQRQDILNSGLVGYVRRRDRAMEEGISVRRGMQGRLVERRLSKAIMKKSWFKKAPNSL